MVMHSYNQILLLIRIPYFLQKNRMEKTKNLQQLDASLRAYIQSNNTQFKCNISSVLMDRRQISDFYAHMYSSALNRKLRLIQKHEPNNPLTIKNPQVPLLRSNQGQNLSNTPIRQNIIEQSTLGNSSLKIETTKAKKSKSVFLQNATVQPKMQLWNKNPQREMSKKPLISGVGESSGLDKKNGGTCSQKSKGQKGDPKKIRISTKFTNPTKNLFSQNLVGIQRQTNSFEKQNSSKAIARSHYIINHQSDSQNKQSAGNELAPTNQEGLDLLIKKSAKKVTERHSLFLIQTPKRQRKQNSFFLTVNGTDIFASIVQMIKKQAEQKEGQREQEQENLKNQDESMGENNEDNRGSHRRVKKKIEISSEQKEDIQNKERETKRAQLQQNYLISVIEEKNRELERKKKLKKKNKGERISEEYEFEQFLKFKQEEEEKYIKKYRLKDKKLAKDSNKQNENLTQALAFEQENWERNRRRELNALFKEFVKKMPKKQVAGAQEKKQEIHKQFSRKEELFRSIQQYFYRKNRYNPLD